MRARIRTLVATVLVMVALGACSVDGTVVVHVREDGSGTVAVRVALDQEAVRAATVGDRKLADLGRLDDLPGAGWTVTPWRRTAGGGAVLVVRKPFDAPEQVRAIVAEINGEHGPFRDFAATREASTFSTDWWARGTVDLRTIDPGVTGDAELVAGLTGARVDPALVQDQLTESALTGLRLGALLQLPSGARDQVVVRPGERSVVRASAHDTDTLRMALLAGGIALGIVALVVGVVGARRSRRERAARGPVRSPAR